MKTTLFLLSSALLLGCSDDGNDPAPDTALTDSSQGGDSSPPADMAGGDSQLPPVDGPQQGGDSGGLPPDLKAWCVGSTAKLRIGAQDHTDWTDMDAPGSMSGKVMTIEPQFKVAGVKHSFYLTVIYTKTVVSPLSVDLANLKAGESVKKNGAGGPVVPASKRAGTVEIVASSGGFELRVCAWVDGESFYFPGMPMG